ncbi:MAG: pseudouridine synthase, partial [Candidatus Omnitrophica bacterium]|nr:pseudouridine synthase [Candidatus Omnitrophota bacterium]
TTVRDPHAKKTTADFFKDVPARLFPVGRLDRDTTGLLIMTNDGDLAFRLSHPRFEVEKRYKVEVKGRLTDEETRRLEKGAVLKEGKTAPCKIQIRERTDTRTRLLIALHEGKKRHIRRIFDKAGHPVRVLERLDIGPLSLGNLKPGERRELKPAEVLALKKAVDPRVV